jgi:hypothetical protein
MTKSKLVKRAEQRIGRRNVFFERWAMQLLGGYVARDHRGLPTHTYPKPGSRLEKVARGALARLILSGKLSSDLVSLLALSFDDTLTDKAFISAGNCQHARFRKWLPPDDRPGRPRQDYEHGQIAWLIWQNTFEVDAHGVRGRRMTLKDAQELAEKEYHLSPAMIKTIWEKESKRFRQVGLIP